MKQIPTRGIIGAICGDCIGSAYEFNPVKTTDFALFTHKTTFTDDSVMTMAVAAWLTKDKSHSHDALVKTMKFFGAEYPHRGYGGNFGRWLYSDDMKPYNSCGNGSAMRVSPVGFFASTLDEALDLAKISAEVTHNHPEGIKGAQATSAAIFLARQGKSKAEICNYIEETFDYDLHRTVAQMRPDYDFGELCQNSVPESIICYLEADDYESCVRNCVSMGGDADTMACIAGGIASATRSMEVPEEIAHLVYEKIIDAPIRRALDDFNAATLDKIDLSGK